MRASLLILTVGAGAAAAAALGYLRARRAQVEKKDLKDEIKRWEDEGGNVPQVPTPGPAGAPVKSVPDGRQ